MHTILLLLPFFLLQLFNKQSLKKTFLSIPPVVCISTLFIYKAALLLYPVIFFLSLCNTIHLRTFGLPLPLKSLKKIGSFSSLKDSINKQIPLISLPFILLGIISYSFLLTPTSLSSLFTIPLLFLSKGELLPYPFLLLSTIFKREKVKSLGEIPTPENEIFYKMNENFPLEKHTTGFTGKQVFSIKNHDKPHVVFIYLESFRGCDVGRCTPEFDKLKEKGIYFSNFYASASQTFKALFGTMYGVPPCFGPDFTESSSKVLTLPLRGLPDFFSERGYTNIFLKAGSHHFENQGIFLKNHCYDALFDETDIKKSNPDAYGTSWGVHDEFLYEFLAEKILLSKEPLFISAASVTNHHPFILPHNFSPKIGKTSFEKTMEYSDYALGKAIEKLSLLEKPMHIYIMGDHGYPVGHNERPGLSPTLNKDVTHIPLLILPIHCGETPPQTINTIASQIDILPTMMDIYNFTGKNSSIGSSLCRKKNIYQAYLLNEAIEPISGIVSAKEYTTFNGYLPLYDSLSILYKKSKISSATENLKTLYFNSIPMSDLQSILDKNPNLESLSLANSPLIVSLDLHFPKKLKKIILDENILISDNDIKSLPKTIEHISINGCRNLTDQTLKYLAQLPIKEISFSCSNFSEEGLKLFLQKVSLRKAWIKNSHLIGNTFFLSFEGHPLEELTINGTTDFSDESVKAIANSSLKTFMCDDCRNLSDTALNHLKKTSLEILHLECGINITDTGLGYIAPLPLHTFYVSRSDHITEDGINKLSSAFMQNLFCIDCSKLPHRLEEKPDKQIYFLNERAFSNQSSV